MTPPDSSGLKAPRVKWDLEAKRVLKAPKGKEGLKVHQESLVSRALRVLSVLLASMGNRGLKVPRVPLGPSGSEVLKVSQDRRGLKGLRAHRVLRATSAPWVRLALQEKEVLRESPDLKVRWVLKANPVRPGPSGHRDR